ncbi:hypothetical protein BJX62DRAFT_238015 [Aspergillus germanicus]
MEDRRRRTRTGCLTCRARRVKCDEQKPTCERCQAANLECAGYEQKRHVEIPRRKRSEHSTSTEIIPAHYGPDDPSSSLGLSSVPAPAFRPDGLPLIGLPNNPTLSQRPHARARDILGYHQYLFRTLDVLFKNEHLSFWRDRLCEEAWQSELVYDAIVSLGGIHRAVLMLSQPDEVDRTRGVDTKVLAVQTYARALQGLSEYLRKSDSVVISMGALVLFAYFECFNGNLPAAFRHIGVAYHYFQEMCSNETLWDSTYMAPIASALQDLELISLMMLPFPCLLDSTIDTHPFLPSPTIHSQFSAGRDMYQYLLDIVAAEEEIQDFIWNPLGAYLSPSSTERTSLFVERMSQWRAMNNEYTLPPRPLSDIPQNTCLALALYTFYNARLFWAFGLSDPSNSSHELNSYFYLYQHLRLVATSMQMQQPQQLPCESIKISYTPMLYVAGHSCPNANWSYWIIRTLRKMTSHGLFNSNAFATNLDILLTLEKSVAVTTGSRGYIAYYAGPEPSEDGEESTRHYPLGVASWSSGMSSSEVELDLFDIAHGQTFDLDWLKGQRAMKDWLTWAGSPGFSLDKALADHINGTRFLPDYPDGRLDGTSKSYNS